MPRAASSCWAGRCAQLKFTAAEKEGWLSVRPRALRKTLPREWVRESFIQSRIALLESLFSGAIGVFLPTPVECDTGAPIYRLNSKSNPASSPHPTSGVEPHWTKVQYTRLIRSVYFSASVPNAGENLNEIWTKKMRPTTRPFIIVHAPLLAHRTKRSKASGRSAAASSEMKKLTSPIKNLKRSNHQNTT